MTPIKLIPQGASIVGKDQKQSREFTSWLQQMMLELHRSLVPPKGVILCHLSVADIAAEFDATGLGRDGSAYQWWALCNGNNDTPVVADIYGLTFLKRVEL